MILFGTVLKQAREQRGLSQQALGDLVGVSKSTIAHYELGNKIPSRSVFDAIEGVFGRQAGEFTPAIKETLYEQWRRRH